MYLYSVLTGILFFLIVLVYSELEATGQFERMSTSVDEDEHSLEMHLPYIARVMDGYVRHKVQHLNIVFKILGKLNPAECP